MAKGTYMATVGIVQQFPEQDVVTERELNEQDIREFTIKTITKQTLVRITLGPEFGEADIGKGDLIGVDGSFTSSEVKGKTYNNIWAKELTVTKAIQKTGEKVAKKTATKAADEAEDDEEAPF